jgi:hypothetical protein
MNKLNPAQGVRWVGSRRSGYTSDLDDDLADSGAPASKVLEQPSPVMPNPFRPDARATYFSTSMRSPMFSSTSARPGAISIEAQYASQVPLERQGPIEMTTGEKIYGAPTLGLQSTIPAQYLQARTHEGSYLRQATLRPAAGPFSLQRSGDPEADALAPLPEWAVGTYSQAQWTALSPPARERLRTAHVSATTPGIGSQIITALIQGGTLATTAYLQYSQADRDTALRLAQQAGQDRLNELIAQNGRNTTDPAVQAQMASLTTALATLGQRMNAPPPPPPPAGPSTGLIVGLAVGGVVLLGGMVLLATRGGGRGSRDNPSSKGRKGRRGRKGR